MKQLVANIVVAFFKHVTWPMLIGIVVWHYRSHLHRILNELPEFIRRSYYRHGGEYFRPAQKGAISIGDDKKAEEGVRKTVNIENGDKLCKTISAPMHDSWCEHQILEWLKSEYGVPIFERQSIGVSNYYFDAVMEHNERLYGIEIQGFTNHSNWDRVFDNVQKAYDGFIPEHKKRFVFMMCIARGRTDDEILALRDKAKRYDFPTVIKYY